MQLRKLLQISRPRFWMYTVWPFLVGVAATWSVLTFFDQIQWFLDTWDTKWLIGSLFIFWMFLTYLFYFIFPANLLIYGVNDIADGDTDQFNTKKEWYEQRLTLTKESLVRAIIKRWAWCICVGIVLAVWFSIVQHYPPISLPSRAASILPHWTTQASYTLFLLLFSIIPSVLAWIAFFFSSIFYSLSPIRAKSKPFVDGAFNVLYIIPGIISYLTFWWAVASISRIWFIAARFRCIAMHTYSAIPDIEPDSKAGLTTTAVLLWPKNTLWYCLILWIFSSILAAQVIGPIAYLFGTIYLWLIITSFYKPVMSVYSRFPWINATIGFILFWIIVYL